MIYIKFYIKLFLTLSIPFGIVMGISRYISRDIVDWNYILFMGVFYGLIMAILLGTAHIINVREELKNGYFTVLGMDSQSKTISSELSFMEIFELLKVKLGAKFISYNQDENIIIAKIGISMQSSGETLKISKLKSQETEQVYKIESKPKLFSTIVDFGKNISNINKVIDILDGRK